MSPVAGAFFSLALALVLAVFCHVLELWPRSNDSQSPKE